MLFALLLGVLSAACLSTVFGFGEALLLIPILTPLIGLQQAVPLVSLFGLIVNTAILLKDRQNVRFRSILPLLISAAACVPLGIYALSAVDPVLIKSLLGGIIVLFALYSLLGWRMLVLQSDRWGWLFGAMSGVMGGAYNISGPPVVVYATLRRWDPNTFRASLQGFFAPLSLVIVCNHLWKGSYTESVLQYFLWGLPALATGIIIGNWIHSKIKDPLRFQKYIYVLLVVLGGLLFF